MKWFKHESDAKDSEKLKIIIDEFGFEGYGRWYRILEIIAGKMDETARCHYEQPESEWCSNLKVKRKQLGYFLEVSEKQMLCKVVRSGKQLRIEVPNLLKKRDDYSKKSGQSSERVRTKSPLEVEVEEEVEVEVEKYNPGEYFEADWKNYPRKAGSKSKAKTCYLKSVNTPEKRIKFTEKTALYISKTDPDFLKYGETWFRGWDGHCIDESVKMDNVWKLASTSGAKKRAQISRLADENTVNNLLEAGS